MWSQDLSWADLGPIWVPKRAKMDPIWGPKRVPKRVQNHVENTIQKRYQNKGPRQLLGVLLLGPRAPWGGVGEGKNKQSLTLLMI